MKNLVCFACISLLCVLPWNVLGLAGDKEMYAKAINIPVEDLQKCLDKVHGDIDTIVELGETISLDEKNPLSTEVVKKVGCFGACLYKTIGMMVDTKFRMDKLIEAAVRENEYTPEQLQFLRSTFQTCINRVAEKTDECDIAISFSRCALALLRSSRNLH